MEIELNGYYTMILATLVLLLGRFLVVKVRFLSDFNIPQLAACGPVKRVQNWTARKQLKNCYV